MTAPITYLLSRQELDDALAMTIHATRRPLRTRGRRAPGLGDRI
jgi:hypothetical protein